MENFEQIERYLLNQMPDDEKAAFEKRLKSDEALRKEKESLAELILGVESLGLKSKLAGRSIGAEADGKVVEMKPKNSFSIRNLAAAASVAAVIFCGWWFLQPGVNADEEMFAQAFVADPGLPTKMSETDNYNFYDAMVEYKMENYEKALEIWTQNTTDIGQDTLDYYIGMALLNQDKYDEAFARLDKVDASSALSDKAEWYLLSILIKKGQFEEAKDQINNISSSIHPRFNEVKEYLENK